MASYPRTCSAQSTASSDTSRGKTAKGAESPVQVLTECLRVLNHKQEKDEPIVFKRLQVSFFPPLLWFEARLYRTCIFFAHLTPLHCLSCRFGRVFGARWVQYSSISGFQANTNLLKKFRPTCWGWVLSRSVGKNWSRVVMCDVTPLCDVCTKALLTFSHSNI